MGRKIMGKERKGLKKDREKWISMLEVYGRRLKKFAPAQYRALWNLLAFGSDTTRIQIAKQNTVSRQAVSQAEKKAKRNLELWFYKDQEGKNVQN